MVKIQSFGGNSLDAGGLTQSNRTFSQHEHADAPRRLVIYSTHRFFQRYSLGESMNLKKFVKPR